MIEGPSEGKTWWWPDYRGEKALIIDNIHDNGINQQVLRAIDRYR